MIIEWIIVPAINSQHTDSRLEIPLPSSHDNLSIDSRLLPI